MSVRRLSISVILLMALVLSAGAPYALAQPPMPERTESRTWLPLRSSGGEEYGPRELPAPGAENGSSHRPVQMPDGLWMMVADGAPEAALPAAPLQVSGGPDDFGYTFDSVPLNWIDASGGTDTGISSSIDSAGPIAIGFPFKYYENTYSQLWVSRHGFLAFNDTALYNDQSEIPSPEPPNDVIAPHWIPSDQSPNYVRYLHGGTAPNRWFVMEWNQQRSDYDLDDIFTFQVILYENGDIDFQYQAMDISGSRWCESSGIEDSTGIDGLSITQFCYPVPGNQAVRITRPAPAARVRIFPQHYGALIYPGEESLTEIPIRNTGELGTDTYDLILNSSWATGLYHADGVTPLTDTNGNGMLDTGPVPQGQTKTVVIKVWSSSSSPVGNHNTAMLTARSSLDASKQGAATARIAVPAPFAQIYRDDADGAMSMMLVRPEAQAARKATTDWFWGSYPAVAELPNHNLIYIWSKGRCLDASCNRYGYEIEYSILNPYGETVRPVAKLTDHSGATLNTYDSYPAVAAAPDGRIGLVWYRYLYNSSNGQSNYNIFWAALSSNGDLAAGPVNVTNNSVWGTWNDLNVPRFYNPVIAASDDSRFMLAWESEYRESAGWVDDIWYAVRNGSGGVVRNPTKLTDDTPGSDRSYYYPTLARLSGNRALLAYSGYVYPPGRTDIYYVVLGSDGAIQRGITNLTNDSASDSRPDAIQLANGRIVLGWSSYQSGAYRTRFAVMDHEFNMAGGPTVLDNPAAITGDFYVSVTTDNANRAVLTWMDNNYGYRRNLYYALVDANGTVLTPATIFRTSQAYSPRIDSSFTGYGNTTHSWTPPAGVDSMLSATPAVASGAPGGAAAPFTVKLQGRGGSPATSVRLVATLDPRLSYVSDTSGVTPTVSGQTVTWNLPDLRLFDIRQFQLSLAVAGAALGERLPVQLQLTSAEPDLTPANNQADVQVWVSKPVYLPVLIKQ